MPRRKKVENYISILSTATDQDLTTFDVYSLGLGALEPPLPDIMVQAVPRVLLFKASELIVRVVDWLLNDSKLTGELSWEEIGVELNGTKQVVRFVPHISNRFDGLEFLVLDSNPGGGIANEQFANSR